MFNFKSIDEIKTIDAHNMFDILKSFPEQIKEALAIGANVEAPTASKHCKHIAVLGMGGSAIGGDLLASFLANLPDSDNLLFHTIRNYDLPAFIDENTFIIASSYSGDTEETISAFTQALKRCKKVSCITTGGKIAQLAKNSPASLIEIPSGLQPRCAIGYSFFPMLFIILKSGLIKSAQSAVINSQINDTISLIEKRATSYSTIDENNLPLNIAKKIYNTAPVIFSGLNGMESVNTRWVRQIQENAKHLAFSSFLPEMNHNEINSFSYPPEITKKISAIMIKDINDHKRTSLRFDALEKLIAPDISRVIRIQSDAPSLLARLFDLIYLGDYVSFYLAILAKVDPTPIPLINKLKNILSSFDDAPS